MKTDIAHFCPEWDYTWIKPEDPEFECCVCEKGCECLKFEGLEPPNE